jgi:hypothetical protein
LTNWDLTYKKKKKRKEEKKKKEQLHYLLYENALKKKILPLSGSLF